MKTSQGKKLLVLLLFVSLLVVTSYFLFSKLVKPSPYYPDNSDQEELLDE